MKWKFVFPTVIFLILLMGGLVIYKPEVFRNIPFIGNLLPGIVSAAVSTANDDFYFSGATVSGNFSNQTLITSNGSATATWTATASLQMINFISRPSLSIATNLSGNFKIIFWCQRSATSSGTVIDVNNYRVFDCTDSTCATKTQICNSGSISVGNCYLSSATMFTSSACSNSTGWVIPSGHYIGVQIQSNSSSGTSFMKMSFNATTTPSELFVNITDQNTSAIQGNNPADLSVSSSNNVTFDAQCSDAEESPSWLQIYTNNSGTWRPDANKTSPTNGTWYNLSISPLTEGGFIWAVYCNDSMGYGWSANRTVTVDLPPTWSNNQTNDTTAGLSVLHSVFWADTLNLSGYIFSFDNGSGTLNNNSFVTFTGASNWGNVTKPINSTVGSIIRWQVYANDTYNVFNATSIFSYTAKSAQCWVTSGLMTYYPVGCQRYIPTGSLGYP